MEEVAAKAAALIPSTRDHVARLFAILDALLIDAGSGGPEAWQELRITSGTRAQPDWSQLEIQWENVDLSLSEAGRALSGLQVSLEGLEEAGLINYEGLVAELASALQVNADLRQRLAEFIPQPQGDGIYWVGRGSRNGDLVLRAAPLHVGETLEKMLFSRKDCVVMTSATMSTNETLDHVRERTRFDGAEELLLGSPFDYRKAALLCVPVDIPEPRSSEYQPAVERAVTAAAQAIGGHTMALFTSHAALQATAAAVRPDLQTLGITVLAQGIDGTPAQLVRRFLDHPKSVLLGTASFWEGVDLPGESLKVLLVTRLPFNVPSEPVFEARSEQYEDPFSQYAIPQAILRLRQGFGRLIRTKSDRGVVVILDRRIVSRRYGKAFVESLPPLPLKTCSLGGLADEIRDWFGV